MPSSSSEDEVATVAVGCVERAPEDERAAAAAAKREDDRAAVGREALDAESEHLAFANLAALIPAGAFFLLLARGVLLSFSSTSAGIEGDGERAAVDGGGGEGEALISRPVWDAARCLFTWSDLASLRRMSSWYFSSLAETFSGIRSAEE